MRSATEARIRSVTSTVTSSLWSCRMDLTEAKTVAELWLAENCDELNVKSCSKLSARQPTGNAWLFTFFFGGQLTFLPLDQYDLWFAEIPMDTFWLDDWTPSFFSPGWWRKNTKSLCEHTHTHTHTHTVKGMCLGLFEPSQLKWLNRRFDCSWSTDSRVF